MPTHLARLAILPLLLATSLVAQEQNPPAADRRLSPPNLSEWLKGKPVDAFDKDRIYVFDCFSTLSSESIQVLPHLTELQKQHAAKVTFVGVAVATTGTDLDDAKRVVKALGDHVGFAVAFDKGAVLLTSLVEASGNQEPTSFVLDGTGKVLWAGSPLLLETVLATAVAGKPIDAAAMDKAQAAIGKRFARVGLALSVSPEKGLAELAALSKERPVYAGLLEVDVATTLLEQGKSKEAAAIAKRVVERASQLGDAMQLNNVAWAIVDPESKLTERDVALALQAGLRAVELTGSKDPSLLDTLARAHACNQDYKQAVAVQKQALAALAAQTKAGEAMQGKDNEREELAKSLAEYEAKLAGKTR